MTAKEYLNQARSLKKEIDIKCEQIEQLKDLAGKATGTYTAERVSGTPARSKMENCVTRIVDLQSEIEADINKLVRLKRDIRKLIASVPNAKHRMVLELRYLNGYTWEKVAVEMSKSYVHVVHRLHPSALEEIKKVIECNTLDLI